MQYNINFYTSDYCNYRCNFGKTPRSSLEFEITLLLVSSFLVRVSWSDFFFNPHELTKIVLQSSTKFQEANLYQIWYFATEWRLKSPKGSPFLASQFGPTFVFFRYCERILDTLKSWCYFWDVGMPPTSAVSGLFRFFLEDTITRVEFLPLSNLQITEFQKIVYNEKQTRVKSELLTLYPLFGFTFGQKGLQDIPS